MAEVRDIPVDGPSSVGTGRRTTASPLSVVRASPDAPPAANVQAPIGNDVNADKARAVLQARSVAANIGGGAPAPQAPAPAAVPVAAKPPPAAAPAAPSPAARPVAPVGGAIATPAAPAAPAPQTDHRLTVSPVPSVNAARKVQFTGNDSASSGRLADPRHQMQIAKINSKINSAVISFPFSGSLAQFDTEDGAPYIYFTEEVSREFFKVVDHRTGHAVGSHDKIVIVDVDVLEAHNDFDVDFDLVVFDLLGDKRDARTGKSYSFRLHKKKSFYRAESPELAKVYQRPIEMLDLIGLEQTSTLNEADLLPELGEWSGDSSSRTIPRNGKIFDLLARNPSRFDVAAAQPVGNSHILVNSDLVTAIMLAIRNKKARSPVRSVVGDGVGLIRSDDLAYSDQSLWAHSKGEYATGKVANVHHASITLQFLFFAADDTRNE